MAFRVARVFPRKIINANTTVSFRLFSSEAGGAHENADIDTGFSPFERSPSSSLNKQTPANLPREDWKGFRPSAFQPEKAYAHDLVGYNTALSWLMQQRKGFMLRDVYEDMLMDGVTPSRDTFHMLIPGSMFSNRLQDSFYFFNEMKQFGIQPDIVLYNVMIAACGKALQVDKAFQIAQEMEAMGISPKMRTFVHLLDACGTAGRIAEANGVVQRMSMHGFFLNPHGYVALINAHKNKQPRQRDTASKILELLEASKKLWDGNPAADETKKTVTVSEALEMDRNSRTRLICHQAALSALVEIRETKAAFKVVEDLELAGLKRDNRMAVWLIRAHVDSGDIAKAIEEFDNLVEMGRTFSMELYMILLESSILRFREGGHGLTLKVLEHMEGQELFLNALFGSKLLKLACKDFQNDYAVASKVFSMMTAKRIFIPLTVLTSFAAGLKRRGVPDNDARLQKVREMVGPHFAVKLRDNPRQFSLDENVEESHGSEEGEESHGGSEEEAAAEEIHGSEEEAPAEDSTEKAL